jgi:hypothetical protein
MTIQIPDDIMRQFEKINRALAIKQAREAADPFYCHPNNVGWEKIPPDDPELKFRVTLSRSQQKAAMNEIRNWCFRHCTAKWCDGADGYSPEEYWKGVDPFFVFASEGDAIMFKLVWCSE